MRSDSTRSVADHVRLVEDRLERLLAAGWRNADSDVAWLRSEIAALQRLGLADLANHLNGVLESRPEDRLARATTARLACRLLRVRLEDDSPPPGNWEIWTTRPRSAGVDRLVPVGRIALRGAEAWACVRLKGLTMDLILVEPLDVADRTGQWLGQAIRGRPRWVARYPLGATGDVPLVALEDYQWLLVEEDAGKAEHLANPWKSLDLTKLEDGKPIPGYRGNLQTRRLVADDADSCAWPDPAMSQAFRAAAHEPVWTIAWIDGPLVVPLAIVILPGFLSPAKLVHLTHGNPVERLEL